MAHLGTYLPDAETLLALEPEDLGAIVLEVINSERSERTTFSHIEMPLWNLSLPGYKQRYRRVVQIALAEAWQWLQNEGLLMADLDQPNGFFALTRRGRKLLTSLDVKAYKERDLLPLGMLHPTLAEKVRPMFLRGDYDVAVLQAFKEVEIRVRAAAKMPADVLGVDLMRKAFDKINGPLRDDSVIPAERDAIAHLFAGAIGHAKNPSSHRMVEVGRVAAAQLIGFASYLMDVVDQRGG